MLAGENVWEEAPPTAKQSISIQRASNEVLSSTAELMEFIVNGTPRDQAVRQPAFEQLVSFLASVRMRDGSLIGKRIVSPLPTDRQQQLDQALSNALESVNIPSDVVERNPGISPVAMQALAGYFTRFLQEGRALPELIPVLPESEDAVDIYRRILGRINSHLAPVFGTSGQVHRYSLLVVNWMRGWSLARIIRSNIRYLEDRNQEVRLSTVIRRAMEDIEKVARFLAPKYTSCYIDILRWFLVNQDEQDLADQIPELNVWLEFGASQTTQLSLIGLGLSRTSAIAISEFIVNDSLDEDGARDWLLQQDWDILEVPRLVVAEVRRLLESIPT